MNEKIICKLFSRSDARHLQQLYAGFRVLHHRGAIRVTQRISRAGVIDDFNATGRYGAETHLKVVVNGEITIYYDTHDGARIDEDALRSVDFYFKRSYSDATLANVAGREKVFPLGLNYLVYTDGADAFMLRRAVLHSRGEQLKVVARALGVEQFLGDRFYAPRLSKMEAPPDCDLPPQVLFMVKAWDPEEFPTAEQREKVEALTEMRAQCIRLLRKEFGRRFRGGFAHEEYAARWYKDCLLPDPGSAKKSAYTRLLKEHPICIATTGLNESTGWKFAEYVAFARAIVTEPLRHSVPGCFNAGENYLEFTTPEGCVAAAARLVDDHGFRYRMMMSNRCYYESHVRPDALVLNTLAVALGRA